MRRLLIVSPHLPPANAPDAHRVRTYFPYFASHGWKVDVITLEAGQLPFPLEPELVQTVPEEITVHRAPMLSEWISSRLGLRASGLRGWIGIRKTGDFLLKSGYFHCVFFSTTAFPLLALGRRWLDRFGVPFVIDLQDPWVPLKGSEKWLKRGVKHKVMRRMHRYMERRTMEKCGGIVAVSDDYVSDIRERHPTFGEKPAVVIPFGVAEQDLRLAGTSTEYVNSGLFIGVVPDAMLPVVHCLCRAIAQMESRHAPHVRFIGTDYGTARYRVRRVAEKYHVESLVTESPARRGFLECIALMRGARFVVVLGSDEGAYIPSKWFGVLASAEKILCIARSSSSLANLASQNDFVELVTFTDLEDAGLPARIASALRTLNTKRAARRKEASDRFSRVPNEYRVQSQVDSMCTLLNKVARS